jgi:RNA polymerase sigma factor for flagellar operon FliA
MQKTEVKESPGYRTALEMDAASRRDRDDLIIEYAPLVKLLANRMAMRIPPSVSVDDLVSAGIMGLVDAIDRYDPSRDVKFKTYAEFRIRGAMLDELRSLDWVPRSTRKKIRKMEQAIQAVEARLNRPAEDTEICEEMEISMEAYYDILNAARGVELLSLDGYVKDEKDNSDSKRTFKSLVRGDSDPDNQVLNFELKEVIVEAMKSLSKKEQMVISLYYYDELTLKEIGEVIELTESRISQIHTKAIIKMRARLRSYYET